MQNRPKGLKTNQGGFFQIIILIIIALAIMQYYNVTIYDVADWIKHLSLTKIVDWVMALFQNVFRK